MGAVADRSRLFCRFLQKSSKITLTVKLNSPIMFKAMDIFAKKGF